MPPLLVQRVCINVHLRLCGGFLYEDCMPLCRACSHARCHTNFVLCGSAGARARARCVDLGAFVYTCVMHLRQLPSCLLWVPASRVGLKET